MDEIFNRYEDAEVIQLERAQQMMAEVQAQDSVIDFTEYGSQIISEADGYRAHFVQADKEHGIQFDGATGWITVSYYFITFDGEHYEVETDGPFRFEVENMGNVLEEQQ